MRSPQTSLSFPCRPSPLAAPIHKNCSLSESALFLPPAQVYDDISHGGVFEDGCLERNHVFPSIHDAVLFAQANAREAAPGCDFQGVRSGHSGNPRTQGTETAGPGALERTQETFWVPTLILNLSFLTYRMGTLN